MLWSSLPPGIFDAEKTDAEAALDGLRPSDSDLTDGSLKYPGTDELSPALQALNDKIINEGALGSSGPPPATGLPNGAPFFSFAFVDGDGSPLGVGSPIE